jgi:Zn finger protein HypA/HybF involved in hydrogenase expression
MTNPGALLVAQRRTEQKVCPECDETFTARLVAVHCPKCANKVAQRKKYAKLKLSKLRQPNADA